MDFDAEYRTLVSRHLPRVQEPCLPFFVIESTEDSWRRKMGRGILLWLLGVPLPVIILLWLFFGR